MPVFNLDDYVTVDQRLEPFRLIHPNWGVHTEVVFDDGQRVVMRAWITDDTDRTVAVGHAEEIRGQGMVNKTSAVENCETSALGRALKHLQGGKGPSREEMEKVERMEAANGARLMTSGHALAEAAARAGFTAKKTDDEETRKKMDAARRDVLEAATGKRSTKDLLLASEVQAALEAFNGIADGTVEFGYDEEGVPTLRKLSTA
jgi:hypothetical protein